jgi:hypothetical protein
LDITESEVPLERSINDLDSRTIEKISRSIGLSTGVVILVELMRPVFGDLRNINHEILGI